ncbi:hypothetical protein EBAPG3_002055 [Nitrosospira lacus]|uniref:Nucleoside phosphorylase domain-containing protein n=1 Tax=Nitrosospira lacus TaxID=1288494 RepID=A0A1W6SLH2_9PROT|nr:hypothetical protein [Nitrosospira lacus]ARO86656.1 hypothetical protein EBAPG3_002055 [Nitrosospira lacus]
MFTLQIQQSRDMIQKIHLCKDKLNAVPDSEKVSSAELYAWIAASEELVNYAFGKESKELERYRQLNDSIPELQNIARKRDGSEWTWTYWINFFESMNALLWEFEAKWNERGEYLGPGGASSQSSVDVVILTVLPEEFNAVCTKVVDLKQAPSRKHQPNLYAWQTAKIKSDKGDYSVAIGMMGHAGNTNSAMAVLDTVARWKTSYILLVGIAGGLKDVAKGDVILADVIYGYEYGKIEKTFMPRDRNYDADKGLLNGAMAHGISNDWKRLIRARPPTSAEPKVIRGEVASGEKVVDDPTNAFFERVLEKWPKINAVEMEGAGAGSAIDQAHAMHTTVGFLMIRGISDLPRATTTAQAVSEASRGTHERDDWKKYAADTAAAFTVSFIAALFPLAPEQR